jgi:mannose/cellobiose epimerase-like protein (N-acyl-D-glucosamine 2-epimerase family)
VQYQLIAADSPAQLEKLVNNELNHGWIVNGGLVTYNVHSNDQILQPSSRFFAQAMIRPIPQHDKKPQT